MARIRTIKPDAFMSDTLSEVSVLARWTFAGLWTYCDDYGKARDDARLIKAALFPIDDGTTLEDVGDALEELEKSGSICRYKVAGKAFLHCPKWSDHQKVSHPTDSKLPDCPIDHLTCALEDSGETPEPLASPPESLAPERKGKEQGKGSGTGRRSRSAPERFEEFWAAYPRRVDKGHAQRSFAKAIKTTDPLVIVEAARAFARNPGEEKFIPYPATWLNGERWADEANSGPGAATTDWGRPEMPAPPPEVADDPELYAQWLADQGGKR